MSLIATLTAELAEMSQAGTMKTEKLFTLKRGNDNYIEIELRPPPKVKPPAPGTAVPAVPATPQVAP